MSGMQQQTIELVAARAAVLLSEWLGLNPIAKNNNGDHSSAGGLGMMLGAMLSATTPEPPQDATDRIRRNVAQSVADRSKRSPNGLWMTYDVDYSPGRELSELAKACEIATSWPIKSSLTISTYRGKVSICDRRGYGDEGLTHYLVDGRGWLVSPCTLDGRVLPLVVAAVDRNEVGRDVARIEPFAA